MKDRTDIEKYRNVTKEYTQLHFFDLVYRQYLIVLICPFDEFYKFMKETAAHNDPDGFQKNSIGYCVLMSEENNDIGNTCLVMWLPERKLSTLVHEITHLVHFVMGGCGVPTIQENTEAVAYYTEHWFHRITQAWVIPRASAKLNHKEKSNVRTTKSNVR